MLRKVFEFPCLSIGIRPNQIGKPLHWASEHAPDSVRLLLDAGADVNGRNVREDSDFFQVTPLIMNATQRDDCVAVTRYFRPGGSPQIT